MKTEIRSSSFTEAVLFSLSTPCPPLVSLHLLASQKVEDDQVRERRATKEL